MYHLNSAFPSNHLDGYKILYNFRSRSLSLSPAANASEAVTASEGLPKLRQDLAGSTLGKRASQRLFTN